jgi:single-strand DNA-binding protein
MAASYNRVVLVGNITRDIELRQTKNKGTSVTDMGLAINEKYKDGDGNSVEETVFVDVTLWGRQAEVAAEYLGKGSPVLIEGRLKLDQWETDDGQKRQKLKVTADRMQMLGGKGDNGGGGGSTTAKAAPATQGDGPDEDVPF